MQTGAKNAHFSVYRLAVTFTLSQKNPTHFPPNEMHMYANDAVIKSRLEDNFEVIYVTCTSTLSDLLAVCHMCFCYCFWLVVVFRTCM